MEILETRCPYLKWIQLFSTGSLVGYFENGKENSGLIKDRKFLDFVTLSFFRI
jgi:hypothetical protein